jgi:hypothetical protein
LGEVSLLDTPLDAALMAVGAFSVHQERQALFESQFGVLWIVELFLQALSKGGQAELDEFVE